MVKYFGTDGVRGIANKSLTPEVAYKIGRIAGNVFKQEDKRMKVLIGLDTRISGPMLEGSIVSGLISSGAEVMLLGNISTPGTAYLTNVMNADMGVMISASHNSFEDNGIKIFGTNGFKLSDSQEAEIEKWMDEEDRFPRPIGEDLGVLSKYFEGSQKYLSHLQETVDNDFSDIHVGLDCANGATTGLATRLFADLEAEISTIGSNPNGININDGVGSTHPEKLQELVKEKELDIGLAFDGDGDRLIAVDEKGNIVDGDQIMYICATHLAQNGMLKNDTIVTTVMSNLGLHKALEARGINVVTTKVGDRYVMESMRDGAYNFGGEQSGHVIFLDYATSGDGLLTGVQLVDIMKETGKKLSELTEEITIYPQVLKNVKVKDRSETLHAPQLNEVVKKVEAALGDTGRVLVRSSGTESLVRVMVEAETKELCNEYVDEITAVIEQIQ
ncbi:MAG TPA: phosphoglucosamine mutase [Pseudogracilibacillus sp.]|nr:phosphoglucosamine mutase [Pseudogracilibacillus sp.]